MNLSKRLSEYVVDFELSDINPEVVELAKKMMIDTFAVSIAAKDSDIIKRTEKLWVREDEEIASIWGKNVKTGISEAALINGTMAHLLDLDDNHDGLTEQRPGMNGHPSAPVLPASIGVAESMNATGIRLTEAFILGVEVEARLGSLLNPGLYENGWHPTAVLGYFGSTVAAGKLSGLGVDEFRHALGITSSLTGGIRENFGTMTKPLHAGIAARGGIEATKLAELQFTANEDMIDKKLGHLTRLFGSNENRLGDGLNNLGKHWEIREPAVWFKRYPSCGSTHAAIDAILELRNKYVIDLDDVEEITITEHPRRIDHTDRPSPKTGLEAKFSVQYCVATALVKGDVWIDDFYDMNVRGIMDRVDLGIINLTPDPNIPKSREYSATVRVKTSKNEFVQEAEGSQSRIMSGRQLKEKYLKCMDGGIPKRKYRLMYEQLKNIDQLDDVSELAILN